MRAVELYSAQNAGYSVTLSAMTPNQSDSVEAIAIASRVGQASFGPVEFKLATPIELPKVLVENDKLKSWSTLQKEIEEYRGKGDTDAAVILEKARDDLRAKLAESAVDVGAGAGGYLGIDGVGFANGKATARLTIDWFAMSRNQDDAAVLSAEFIATGKARVANKRRLPAVRPRRHARRAYRRASLSFARCPANPNSAAAFPLAKD